MLFCFALLNDGYFISIMGFIFKKGNSVMVISFFTIVPFLLMLLARLFC